MREIEIKNCYVEFGKLVKEAREQREWSQRDLAKLLGITQPYVCKLEQGERNISLDLVMACCRILKIDIQEFVKDFI